MSCPFCSIDESYIAFSNDSIIAFWDGFPVSPGHLLIIPRRHASVWANLSSSEKAAIWSAIDQGQRLISERFHPEGFNVGFNEKSAATGQTASHFHLHILPRYEGDVVDPRGGVRHVIPHKANYLVADNGLLATGTHQKLVTGGADPLLPHLLLHLDGSTTCDIAVAFLLDSGARMIVAHLRDFLERGGQRCIAFCCSQRHANFMAAFFNGRGLRAVAVHAGDESAPRTTSLHQLANGEIDVIFSVDMFNEGVDVPNIDTILMLRPTESTVIWMQQFGRGLRRAPDKPFLKVIDYIGNHRSFLMKLRSIAAVAGKNANSTGALRSILNEVMHATP